MGSHTQPSSLAEEVEQLKAMLAALRERVEQSATAEEILRRASTPRRPAAHTRRRDRHGLHIVPGIVAAALTLAVRSRKVMAAAAITTLAGGAVLTPAVLPSGPPASAAGHHAPAPTRTPRPRTAAGPDEEESPPGPARKRRRPRRPRPAQASPSATPSLLPLPSVVASPLPTLPDPDPTVPDPTVTPTDPLPSLPGSLWHGRGACHSKDWQGPAVACG